VSGGARGAPDVRIGGGRSAAAGFLASRPEFVAPRAEIFEI